ncbi:MAG: Eco57I restriction-modification methylase domain-containing protein [Anaerolineaceae bacterium]|nr:Eco57I restriction-modification methylase domain-containing protein [Anaerolineaceae bacterium]
MNAPDSIHELVERFEEQRAAYHTGKYNETQLRLDFLNPFFEALGWDVSNRKGYAERYREVLLEPSVEVEGQAKAADFAFRVGDKTLFFVEAKKPAVNIAASPEPAFQVRRYAWSAKLSLSILSDFEQLAVYDCRTKPKHGDPASCDRVQLYSFRDYLDKWDEISAIFSREAVLKGSFDKFAEGLKGKKGTADVDDAFLEEMERWREELAHNIALRNLGLSQRELNSAVQLTIDRIIFLRICEERGIEAQDALQNAAQGKDIYQNLISLFRQADKKYNSGLFHFSDEKKQSSPSDTLTLALKIDDKVLKDILAHLYYPLSPYAFKYIPTDILGQVYERFLGRVIRLTPGHQAKVEEKPEVRKAGGVFYTPTYIVSYIVKHTLGELLKDQTPESQKNKPLRVLDPACGSGSFLLGAYQYLLDWYLDGYIRNDPARWSKGKAPALLENPNGWQLTMDKKKEILLSHIYGVDIDAQAVEVTKLSLLLKVVENPGQLSWLNERILPDLGENIKCGNSLIGPDYYDGRQIPMFGDEETYRLNVFDWQNAFPLVFYAGGFDAVIGNPPYIRIQALQEWAPAEVEFYKKRYIAASKGNYDIYVVFVEKALSLLNRSGRLGYILPHKFFNAQYGEPLRGLISTGNHLAKVVHFSDQQVFDGATTYTCLMFLEKNSQDAFDFEKVIDLKGWRSGTSGVIGRVEAAKVTSTEWNFTVGDGMEFVNKLSQMPVKLENIAKRIFQGFKTGADPIFILEERGNGKFYSNALKSEVEIEPIFLRPLYKSGNMKRYTLQNNSRFVIFPYRNGILIPWNEISLNAPKTAEYLKACKDMLAKRENGKWVGSYWYCYSRNQALEIISSPKLLTADLNPFANYCFDESGQACFPGGAAGGYGIVLDENMYFYVLGLLNSKAVDYYHKKISSNFRGGWFGYDAKIIRNIPIRTINFSDPVDAARHAQMVALVEGMLALHKLAAAARLPQEKEMIQRQILATDRQIDRLVYELYGLTEEEIKIVEGG